jgi:MFS family permease
VFALLLVPLVDELWSGVAVSGAPSVEHELALSHRGYLAFAFVLPLVAAALLEAGLALLSDVVERARLIVLGQAALAAALFFTAWTSNPWGLTLGLAFAGASSGVACGAAQALLIDSARPLLRAR